MSKQNFAEEVKTQLKSAGYSLKILANELGVNSSVLSHKLNGTGRFILTYPEIRQIVLTLARLEAITKKAEALELLELANCPGFSSEEWKTSPLKNLEEKTSLLIQSENNLNKSTIKKIQTYLTNLPVQLTSFIGRERQIDQAKQLFSKTHLLTLAGAGGVGKTRLALQIGTEMFESFKDGVWLVELAPISDPALVPQVVVQVLELRGETGRSLSQTLIDYFKARQTLLIMDNCEHLMEPCATLMVELLRNCPDLRILATSRETFGITGEVTYRVPSLSLPVLNNDGNQTADDLEFERLSQFEAVRLFIDRAKAVHSEFNISNLNAPTIAEICYRLDGIPLAIELAAARVSYLSVEQIMQNLDDRFRLLKGESRTVLPRQQTLRALIDWSHNLLSQEEQIIFRRLAVFAGGWTIVAAIKVCSGKGIEEDEVMDYLFQLVKKSLVLVEEASYEEKGEARYRMLETIRQYGLERLEIVSEKDLIQLNHLNYFLNLAEESEEKIKGADQLEWMNKLEKEQDNIRAAIAWAIVQRLEEPVLRITGALEEFWAIKGYLLEGRKWAEASLALNTNQGKFTYSRAKALYCAGWLAAMLSDSEPARTFSQQSLELYQSLGDLQGSAYARSTLGMLLYFECDYVNALPLVEQSLNDLKKINDRWGCAVTLSILGYIKEAVGEVEEATKCYKEGLILCQEIRNKNEIAWFNYLLGTITGYQHDLTRAACFLEESIRVSRELGAKWSLAVSLDHLGKIEMLLGHFERSKILQEEGLTIYRKIGDRSGLGMGLNRYSVLLLILKNYTAATRYFKESLVLCLEYNPEIYKRTAVATCLEGLGFLNWHNGKKEKATKLLKEAERIRLEVNLPPIPIETLLQERFISIVKETIEVTKFENKSSREESTPNLDLEQVISLALEND